MSWREKLPKGAHPKILTDDEGVDQIVIDMVPRFKTSGLSGDEWRVSARVRFFRNGEVVHEDHRTKLNYAVTLLPGMLLALPEQVDVPLFRPDPEVCFQPGCSEPAISTYLLKKDYCVGGGNCGQETKMHWPEYRRFCERHLRRGDCSLDDADENYEVLDGPGPDDRLVDPTDQSPSAFGGVIDLRPTQDSE